MEQTLTEICNVLQGMGYERQSYGLSESLEKATFKVDNLGCDGPDIPPCLYLDVVTSLTLKKAHKATFIYPYPKEDGTFVPIKYKEVSGYTSDFMNKLVNAAVVTATYGATTETVVVAMEAVRELSESVEDLSTSLSESVDAFSDVVHSVGLPGYVLDTPWLDSLPFMVQGYFASKQGAETEIEVDEGLLAQHFGKMVPSSKTTVIPNTFNNPKIKEAFNVEPRKFSIALI